MRSALGVARRRLLAAPSDDTAVEYATLAIRELVACGLGPVQLVVGTIRHATDGGECTWFEFASAIVREVGAPCRVLPCTTSEFPRPARRPAYSVLDLSQTEAALGPMKPWTAALHEVIARLEKP